MHLKLEDIVVDPRLQSRVELNEQKIEEYASLYDEGTKFPPVSVMNVDGRHMLIDGFHRLAALQKLGDFEVEAVIMDGSSYAEALMASWAANKTHGLTRSHADKRHVAKQVLESEVAASWSDRSIAKHIGVSHVFVWKLREEMKQGVDPGTKPRAKAERQEPKAEAKEEVFTVVKDEAEAKNEEIIQELVEENDRLRNSLALNTMPEDMREAGETLIEDLRSEIKLLQVELAAVKKSRDTFQAENAQLKKQLASQQRKLKQLEKE